MEYNDVVELFKNGMLFGFVITTVPALIGLVINLFFKIIKKGD